MLYKYTVDFQAGTPKERLSQYLSITLSWEGNVHLYGYHVTGQSTRQAMVKDTLAEA
jgi:hypothetical protein